MKRATGQSKQPRKPRKRKYFPPRSNMLGRRRQWLCSVLNSKPNRLRCPECREPLLRTVKALVCSGCLHKMALPGA